VSAMFPLGWAYRDAVAELNDLRSERGELLALLSEWHGRYVSSLDKQILSHYPDSLEWKTHVALAAAGGTGAAPG
jgi:hypothetical protein